MLYKSIIVISISIAFQHLGNASSNNICFIFRTTIHLNLFQDSTKTDSVDIEISQRQPSMNNLKIYGDNYVVNETAFTQGKGNSYFITHYQSFYKFSYGLTNRIDLEAVVSWPIVGAGIKTNILKSQIISLSSKLNYSYVSSDFSIKSGTITATVGSLNNNLSISLNHSQFKYSPNYTEYLSQVSFSGKIKVKNNIQFQFENFSLLENHGLTTIGLSFQKKFIKLNVGLLHYNSKIDIWTIYNFNLPYITVKIPLNKIQKT